MDKAATLALNCPETDYDNQYNNLRDMKIHEIYYTKFQKMLDRLERQHLLQHGVKDLVHLHVLGTHDVWN